ncbi:CHAT domain-containing protein [Aerosakkonema funiforme]|uniref:CHAT domain-containing protein n=2 Tax=Oscillatoriophycideae TaxID=1301283 RepID=A0A926ZEB1_9CYAN|nr:CHAT domain-containing tetratricopeptide repeat protein [Aerosakkonema funiforme]MBD2179615.1 CHAT domain-containing protein [Aerosakkonema funiforme FACHB-1375]
MDEQRIAAYLEFIQNLLECASEKEPQSLKIPSELVDTGLLQMIIIVAKQFYDNDNQNGAKFLTNLALQLGEILASAQQPIVIREETADILFRWGNEQFYINHTVLAFHCWQQCLIIYQAIDNPPGKAIALGNLGNASFSLAKYEQAISYWKQTLDILQEIKDSRRQVNALGNLGKAYFALAEYEQAINFYELSLGICREIKDRAEEASLLLSLGIAYHSLGKYERALDCHKNSLAIYREIKHRQGEAASGEGLGITYNSLGKYKQAISYHKQSLAIYREIKEPQGEASSLTNLGIAYNSLGEYEQASDFHQQSLNICRKIKYQEGEASSLIGLGNAYDSLGEYQRAISYHEESLVIKKNIKDRRGEATALGNLGNTYLFFGEYERAISYHEQSLSIKQKIKDRQGEANSLISLGNAYLSLGQYEQAITFYNDSLAICQQIEDRQGEATCVANLGSAYCSLGEYEQAIDYHQQSLAICREIEYRQGEAASLGNIGNAYLPLGKYEQAIAYHEQSLAICREIKHRPGEAAFLNNIAIAYRELQQTEVATKNYRDCLKIANPKTMPAECFKAGENLGYVGFTQNNWHLALEGYEPAMQAVEQLRKGSTTDKRRQEIIKEAISVYANAVQCYINLKQYDKAVETADRSRSRHLADLFASKDLYPQGEIPPEVEEYYRLQQQSNRLRSSDNDPMKSLATTRQPTPNGDAIIEKIKELEAEKQQAWLKIRSKDRVLAGQLQPDPLSFDQMQALIPDAETAILNFYTTREHTHIFILRKNQSTKLYTCEGQGIESLQNWIFDNWLIPYKENPTPWQKQMGEFLSQLANRLQINRLIEQHFNGIKELIIIPHLYLHQIPFAALPLNNIPIPHSDTTSVQTRGASLDMSEPIDTPDTPSQQPEYLSDKYRIRIVPSCQILNFCDQRVNLKPAIMGIVENTRGDLVFTGYECETLAKMHKVSENNRLRYQKATISEYQNLLDRVQVLHSSHHAESDLNNSLESKLKLYNDDINLGRLFTWRFSHLAEVFLSCCETNLTLTQITDDPLSIASGFLCAGARNVVSTLWSVDDLATALFCILYYQEKQDKGRSEAIRQAQFKLRNLTGDELYANHKRQLEEYFEQKLSAENKAEIIKNVRVRLDLLCRETLPFISPYYWSGFVSQGLA